MHIKKNDMVVVLTGKDKGKTGKVLKVLTKSDQVLVEKINMQTKHQKQTRTAASEIRHQEGPLHVSNVMLVDSKTKKGTRVGYKMEGDKKVRISKASGEVIK